MLFSERQKLEKEYYKWLDQNKNIKPCAFNVISFLSINGNLISKEEHNKIEILKKALELACKDIFDTAFPSLKNSKSKHSKLMCFFINEAKKKLGEKK